MVKKNPNPSFDRIMFVIAVTGVPNGPWSICGCVAVSFLLAIFLFRLR